MFQYKIAIVLCTALTVQASEPGCTSNCKKFKVGEQYDVPGHCNYHVCKGNNEWTTAACGIVGAPQGWKTVPEDPSKPYPKCCAHVLPPLDIVPDVLNHLKWSDLLEITYEGDIKVRQGNELTPTQVKNQPAVNYSADDSSWYLLCMTDPDAPSRQDHKNREILHWLIGNIQGNNIPSGEVFAEYIGSGATKGTGLHRYVFLVYKQPGKLTFDEPRIPNTTLEGRVKFSIKKFAEKYKLGDPIAVNVFQAQYDDSVPQLYQQLGYKPN